MKHRKPFFIVCLAASLLCSCADKRGSSSLESGSSSSDPSLSSSSSSSSLEDESLPEVRIVEAEGIRASGGGRYEAGDEVVIGISVAKGYKAIGVAPLSPTNLINGIVAANQKGIYVMNIDEKVDMDTLKNAGGSVIAFATTDNVKVGEKGANYIISKLTSGGDVAIIEGKAGNASGEARKQGATDAFKAATGINLVGSQPADWDRQKALDTAASMIQQNPNLKAIYCCNDTMALGALQAVKNAGKLGEILVVGTDGAAEALKSVEAGELSATVAQDSAEIGAVSLRQMVEAVKAGAAIDPNATPETIPVDSYIVEKKAA